jgi:hypothetical protein
MRPAMAKSFLTANHEADMHRIRLMVTVARMPPQPLDEWPCVRSGTEQGHGRKTAPVPLRVVHSI